MPRSISRPSADRQENVDGIAGLPNGSGTVDEDGNEVPPQAADERPKEPTKRFTWTPEMREVFQELVTNSNLMLEMNKKAA